MTTLPSQNLQSVRPLYFSSINSLKFGSQIPSLKFPILLLKLKPAKLFTSNNGTNNSGVVGKASTSEFSADIGDVLGDVTIFTAADQPVFLKDLRDQNQGIAVVAHLRHFGCPCCWELALGLEEAKARFESAGVKLIAIGVGTPNKARLLAERLPFPMDCLYADPNREAYDILGLYYGFGRTFFNPASTKVFSRFESLQEAATPDETSSVLQQVRGMFVFKGNNYEGTGDHAPLDQVFDICCKVPA
ncbi:hypothetical protein GOBAR_AA02655 [Gossypium barbadense]|uniref:Thioredoxin domain-containing protein n=1 Tax=Gossypium barbadense TaxID=3634 RepID=A0A2P5YQS5_GOSBA|nr:hypothetical protein GOBAR_AA02655 [Gossypium barbadense]